MFTSRPAEHSRAPPDPSLGKTGTARQSKCESWSSERATACPNGSKSSPSSLRPLAQQGRVRGLVAPQPARRLGAGLAERRQLATRSGVLQRGENDLGQTVPDPQRRRRDHAAPAVDCSAGTGGGSAGAGGAALGRRSTRVPAIRAWSARLSWRSPAITKPRGKIPAEAKYAR